ncbi:MAG: prepilin-type N-terminal cleavage/methylation domain-containing protein, partial [Deltaproteobacteria bacterium]|nr:prepilin-type N-terminal cleavage/methylation domain-containing protein [Deltaproteobacteria bacterium]
MANRKTREKGHIFFFKACAKGKGRINKKGFTLLELILSLSILSVLVVLMAGVMSLGSRAWDRGEEMSNDSQKIRISLGLIAKQLKSIYPFS